MSEHLVQLPSGLTIVVEPMVSTRTAAIGVWVGVGARDETPRESGLSHFLEHLLFKGTETRTAIDISQAIDRVGGDINAFTSKEYTAYYCRLPARHTSIGVELLGDVVAAPALRDDDVESERQVILEELAMDDDSPEDVVHRAFGAAVFGDHPLGRDTAGDKASVLGLTADDVRSFYRDRYVTENTIVAVAGAVDPDIVIEEVATAFDRLRRGNATVDRRPPDPAAMRSGQVVAIDDDTEQVHMVVGGRSLARNDPDRDALDIANHVLGGGLSSRLFDEIRERRGLAYSVFSSAAAYADVGSWSIYSGTLPEHADEVRRLVGTELERLLVEGITPDELEIAQGYLAGSYEMGLEDSGARMSRLGGQLTVLGRLRSVEEQLDRWSNVSLDDANRVIGRVYGEAEPVTVTVGPT
ncbi:M16 family metallopeptidase [Ilumatobacter sp.]|uniref:M16 family metallopeptidase n=1 Tax=Ilumatobacter sp. TaxID=1967498 RepID=UPI003AF75C73